ncbi:RDD family protein [Streptomyces sp. NPDC006367]|uniref:RDD family protein n=1 Tax=unclassified Streptomyces TaxID=2593676 RepID=UPI0033AE6FCB
MSAPTPAPGDDSPREGYYPDPSIPGYVRYWNGASWVAGTSRPAPKDGEPLTPPPGVRPAAPPPASVEETGPHFFDEDPAEEPPAAAVSPHGSGPEPASSWAAGPSARPVSGHGVWPDAQGADPRVPHAPAAATGGPAAREGSASGGAGGAGASAAAGNGGAGAARSGPVSARAGESGAGRADGGSSPSAGAPAGSASAGTGEGTVVFRRPTAGPKAAPAATGRPAADEGTITFRAVPPGTSPRAANTGAPAAPGPAGPQPAPAAVPAALSGPQRTGTPGGPAVPRQAAAPQPQPVASPPQPAAPAQPRPAVAAPAAAGQGGGQASWAQQVHRLADNGGDEQPVAPWKPPVDDVFQAAARRQAAARPAGLGKRLAARLIDTVVLAAVTSAAAVPLGVKALDHVNDKIDQAKLSGETVTVWLLDGTTGTYLGVVLAVLLLFGVLYEALPTAKWGRTLGKKLLGLEVRDIEAHEPPSFGAALRRWLVYSVPGLLAVGVVGVAWCLFDRPWHQCWHDKAARTFVAG